MNRSFFFLLLALASCATKPGQSGPAADTAYVFPHSAHADGGVDCLACHDGIQSATALEASAPHVSLPAHPSEDSRCKDCHDKDVSLPVGISSGPFRLRFDHQAHLKLAKDCKSCHTRLPDPRDRKAAAPPMAACTGCHQHQAEFAQARCTPCHVDLKGLSPESSFKHQGDWLHLHGPLAKSSAETCAQCHDQTSCTSCHSPQTAAALPAKLFPEEVGRAFIHRGDYVSRHSVEANANPASCLRCHGNEYCQTCHRLQGSTPDASRQRNVHPLGWSQGDAHGAAARRDISRCAACHDDGAATLCVDCHKVGGIGGNPHPKSFTSKHSASDQRKNSMCKICHTS